MKRQLHCTGLADLPEVAPGADLGELIGQAIQASGLEVRPGDIFVVAQKIVSKAEGQIQALDEIEPSPFARTWASAHDKDPRVVEVVLRQSQLVLRMGHGVMVTETHHGFVCANSGVDSSNTPQGYVTLLPEDCDGSADDLRQKLETRFGPPLAVIISDTFGRPWRHGLTNVALGVSGINPVLDHRGTVDSFGRPLQSTMVAVADEIASAADLLMGKTEGVPVVVIQGYDWSPGEGSGKQLMRPRENDLFR